MWILSYIKQAKIVIDKSVKIPGIYSSQVYLSRLKNEENKPEPNNNVLPIKILKKWKFAYL